MLVLSRKLNERIVIGQNVVVVVKRISGNRVTIGIDAPKEMPVKREDAKGRAA
jgi:carbon storage regulator